MSAPREIARELGLSECDWNAILDLLGREPSVTETGIFGAMWSEHCSYRSSGRYLRRLPSEGAHVLQGPGENAGAVGIGGGKAVIFKMESHNHPSFIDPYQGAATGVGGIMRDIFTMGARPVALLNALRFGDPDHPRTPYLLSGVVSGIGDYGNCVGIPTVGGEVDFDEAYNENILVNAMCVGVADEGALFRAAAREGHKIFAIGARTGRDGLHGAVMASAQFDGESGAPRAAVQIGDPFMQKLLLEASLELMAARAIAAAQDMGAAGLASSAVEMAARGGTGIRLALDEVPCREEGMTAYEIMLSESQERMLLAAPPDKETQIREICEKWDLPCASIGEAVGGDHLEVFRSGKREAHLPLSALSSAPERRWKKDGKKRRPAARRRARSSQKRASSEPCLKEALLTLLATPDLCSRKWVWEQYDHTVMGDSLHGPGGDAAVVRVHGTSQALAMTTEATPSYLNASPYEGAKQAVAEAWRNLSAVGAKPLALTDCLNFGSPENPEIMRSFVEAIEGLAEAARHLETPVISGNVSFYNETGGRAIIPTPAIGAVGLIEDYAQAVRAEFRGAGEHILLIGETAGHMGCALFADHYPSGRDADRLAPPPVDLEAEKRHGIYVRAAAEGGLLSAAHDLSRGGLAVALAEMALTGGIGAEIEDLGATPNHDFFFAEDQARYLLCCRGDDLAPLLARAEAEGVPARVIGRTGGESLTLSSSSPPIDLELLREAHEGSLPAMMRAGNLAENLE